MEIAYDPDKNARNIETRGLSFDEVADFEFETALRWEDVRQDYGETRYCALGKIAGRVHSLVYESTEKTNRKGAKGAEVQRLPERKLCVLCAFAVKLTFFQWSQYIPALTKVFG